MTKKKPTRRTRTVTQQTDSTIPQIRKALIAAGELVLVMRCVHADMKSSRGFRWPESGPVEAPAPGACGDKSEWKPTRECGHGLHGWLWGAGDLTGTCDYWDSQDTKWLLVEVAKSDVVDLDGKVKFPRGTVVFCGDRSEAAKLIVDHAPAGTPVIFGTATAGYGGTATAGDGGTATAGERGTATAGYGGTATAGYGGTATAGYGGTATAGYGGTVSIEWYDASRGRYRKAIAEVDGDLIKADVAYVVGEDGKLTPKAAQ
ncbi:MAG TPA: hypothetical protein VFQ42_21990 [Mycobacterium sp.]|nr:hypothetical protein [Mycobacterium sp.]